MQIVPSTAVASSFVMSPSSPTFTNPEMILPGVDDYHYDGLSSQYSDHQFANPADWTGGWFDDLHKVRSEPLTPIIYGNGTMLSDIGEVTEVENTPVRRQKPASIRSQKIDLSPADEFPPPFPKFGHDVLSTRSKFGNHLRQVSVESTDTIRTLEEPQSAIDGYQTEDDDAVSVGDSSFQGDDEESIADSTYDHQLAVAQVAMAAKRENVHAIMTGGDSSSGALSRRAELILANAKMRLDTMEGNLTRARHSQSIAPSSSTTSFHSTRSHQTSSPDQYDIRSSSNEITIHNHARHLDKKHVARRSHLRAPYTDSDSSANTTVNSTRPTSAVGGAILPLEKFASRASNKESLNAAGNTYTPMRDSVSDTDDSMIDDEVWYGSRPSTAQHYRPEAAQRYAIEEQDHYGIASSASSMQMRDLTEKMKGLKGKISDLRDRAREDSLKRTSMQSLRTPSPFTASDDWKESPSSGSSGSGREKTNGVRALASKPRELNDEHASSRKRNSSRSTVGSNRYTGGRKSGAGARFSGNGLAQDVMNSDATEQESKEYSTDNESDSDVSLYHDAPYKPVSHEDREDAFDYQHFFLHSAMGTVSQELMNRRDSVSSEDSVQTARALSVTPEKTTEGKLRRENSESSLSTLATFQTATEHRSPLTIPSSEEGVDYFKSHTKADDANEQDLDEHVVPETENMRALDGDGNNVIHSEISNTDVVQLKTSEFSILNPSDKPTVDAPRELLNERTTPGMQQFDKDTVHLTSTSAYPARPTSSPQPSTNKRPVPVHKTSASVSGFASNNGVTRSFPLINKSRNALAPAPTWLQPNSSVNRNVPAMPHDSTKGTPPPVMKNFSMKDSPTSALRREYYANSANITPLSPSKFEIRDVTTDPVSALLSEDRTLVKQLVASMGKCVLGLQEAGNNVVDAGIWRKRMEIARRVLEGEEL